MSNLADFFSLTAAISVPIALSTYFLKSYLQKKGDLLATKEEFEEIKEQLIANTKATEEVKHKIQRKSDARVIAKNEILSAIAEIESTLYNWRFFIYFRKKKNPSAASIEEIGTQDLADVAELLSRYHSVISRNSIHFNTEVIEFGMLWFEKVYKILFTIECVYQTSLEYHKEKDATDAEKITWMSSLFEEEVAPKLDEIGLTKRQLITRISEDFEENL